MICLSVFETTVLGSIAFFASAISDMERVIQSNYLIYLENFTGANFSLDSKQLIIFLSITVVILVILKNFFQAFVNYWSIRFAALVEGIFGEKILTGILNMPYEWHLSQNSSDLLLVSANWRSFIGRKFIYLLIQLIADMLLIIIMLTTLLIVQPIVSIFIISIIGASNYILFTIVRRKLDVVALQSLNLDQKINQQATKMIHGFKDVKISGKQKVFIDQYRLDLYQLSKIQAYQQVISGIPVWLLELIGFLMISFSICFMLFVMNFSVARVSGTVTLLAVTAWRVLPAFSRILSKISTMRNVIPYIEKIMAYHSEIESNHKNKHHNAETVIGDFSNNIQFKNVSFLYKNSTRYALKNVTLTIQKGSTIGIIGRSGSGKSTFVDILTGLLSPTQGHIYIDNECIDRYDLRIQWMTKLGYVPQTPYIFDGTIAENIAFEIDPKNINKQKVLECCHMAAMDDFINDLPHGLDSNIGERGVRLSGGQRQRVSIARALYQDPEIIIFDEATSALDEKNEKAIQQTISRLRGKQTLLIVAHRLTTVESCDIIYQFNQGKVEKKGLPNEILHSVND